MRIPLDYYQILGVPTVATMGQIQQAYADRNLQQPRHEYNSTAIESRRKLLSDAYEVLAHPGERSQYDAALMEAHPHFDAGENPLTNLEVSADRVLGAFLVLAEIGEYEKLLSISWPLLGDDVALQQAMGGGGDLEEIRQALHLTAALTLLESGREQWRQGKPADGCEALETSLKLLRQQDIYPTVQSEIQRELYKFRPQYILSILSSQRTPNGERQQALSLLQDLIVTCSAPRGYSVYGMTQDGFIAYLDQIRRHLATHEQQNLFEEPSNQSENPVFPYLLVYAMIARGFHYQMPELIYRAQQLLTRHLSRRQDVFIEQALCSLLLGHTAEAQQALASSSDRETLAYIQKNSPSTDLLPGLCRYCELWFQTQVFPHFADLAHHRVSLNTYFDNPQVQIYLNDLPAPSSGSLSGELTVVLPELAAFNTLPSTAALTNYRGSVPLISSLGVSEPLVQLSLPGETPTADKGVPILRDRTTAKAIVQREGEGSIPSSPDNVVPFERPKKKSGTMPPEEVTYAKSPSNPSLSQLSGATAGPLAAVKSKAIVPRKNMALAKRRRYRHQFQLLIGFTGLMSALALVTWMVQTNKFSKQFTTTTTASPGSSTAATLPIGQTPDRGGISTAIAPASPTTMPTVATDSALTIDSAQSLLEKWLAAKATALSPSYDVSALTQVLAEPALTRARIRSQEAKANGSHWEYKHQVKVQSVDAGAKSVEALVSETASFFDQKRLINELSYQKNLRLKYELVQQEGRWLIKNMTVIQ
jgi:ARC6-like, IMS domain/DnaJ domain